METSPKSSDITSNGAIDVGSTYSSSSAFATPAERSKPTTLNGKPQVSILPILLSPASLRPVAFRAFTRKHNLTLVSSALQLLATFIGKNCGSGWREQGLAEPVLDEIAKAWRKSGGGVIVEDGNGTSLTAILQAIEGAMAGGRIIPDKLVSQDRSTSSNQINHADGRPTLAHESRPSLSLSMRSEQTPFAENKDPGEYLKVIGAFEQPRLVYNASKKHFETASSNPSLFPPPSHLAATMRDRYNLVHQRLLRNESFQASMTSAAGNSRQAYKLTPVANLLGRNGSAHLLLGLLANSPTGELSLTDLTGGVVLDISHAKSIPENGAWFVPGMIVLVDGVYEGEEHIKGSTLGNVGGVGGTIGGRFVAISIAGPPCERREVTLGISKGNPQGDIGATGGFGWVDFLGVGSERVEGSRMRGIQQRYLRNENEQDSKGTRRIVVVVGEVNLDNAKCFAALRAIFSSYEDRDFSELPLAFILIGNFVEHAAISGTDTGNSVEYKECFDTLAQLLSEYPILLRNSKFIFVPGDNDPWSSAFTAGAAAAIPRESIPEVFTSRVKRAFTVVNSGADSGRGQRLFGEAIWTSNPCRLSLFGPVQEITILRDDISGRLRRNAIAFPVRPGESDGDIAMQSEQESVEIQLSDVDRSMQESARGQGSTSKQGNATTSLDSYTSLSARKLVKTVLDQGYLSPFPISTRPVLWDYASSLQLYPLPTAFVLSDAESPPFSITYEGCHVMNPSRLLREGMRSVATWVEYDIGKNRSKVREGRY